MRRRSGQWRAVGKDVGVIKPVLCLADANAIQLYHLPKACRDARWFTTFEKDLVIGSGVCCPGQRKFPLPCRGRGLAISNVRALSPLTDTFRVKSFRNLPANIKLPIWPFVYLRPRLLPPSSHLLEISSHKLDI